MRLFQLYLISGLAVLSCGPQPDSSLEVPFEASVQEAPMGEGLTSTAQYDGARGAPLCSTVSSSCDSGALLRGRALLGPESNWPNTLDSCHDGAGGQYQVSPSVEWIRVATVDGSSLAVGKRARVDVSVWASNPSGEELEVYLSYNADLVGWSQRLATLRPTGTGEQVLSTEFTLGSASVQAVRAAYGYAGSASSCRSDGLSDHDDLAFTVSQVPDTTAPSAVLTSPAAGTVVAGTVTLTATASDDFAVTRVEFYDGSRRIGTDDYAPYSVSWGTYSLPNGSHTLTARARDYAGNVGSSSAVVVTVDNDHTDPVTSLTSPADGAILEGMVTLTATASDDRGVVTGVDFYAGDRLLGTALTPPYELLWNTEAEPAGEYTLRTWAHDPVGNTGLSAPVTVTIIRDFTPPTASITSPTANTLVTGIVTVEVEAQDDVDVTKVELYDGSTLVGSDTTAPFTVAWDTGSVTDGAHTLSAKAYDAAGRVGTSEAVPVTVDKNAPGVSLTAPATGAIVRGTVQLTATASDDRGIARVEFHRGSYTYPNGELLGTDTTAPYAVSWDSTTSVNSFEIIRAVAFDLAGNVRESATVHVTVDNTAPIVSITSPGNGATVSLSTTIHAAASDASGVKQVAFYDGTKLLGTDTTAPFSLGWSLLLVARGQHTLTARATDVVGNVTTSAAVVVTVQ